MSLSYHHDYFGGAAGKRFATLKKSYEAKSGVRLPDFPRYRGSGKPSRLAKKTRNGGSERRATIENVGMAARKDGMAGGKDRHTGECGCSDMVECN